MTFNVTTNVFRVVVHVFLNIKSFSALTLLVGWQEGQPACKKTEWRGVGVVICLERGADLHMAQLMSLPLTVSCFSKIQIGFTFLLPAHLGSPGKGPLNGGVCVCVCLLEHQVTRSCYSLLLALTSVLRAACGDKIVGNSVPDN